jgi:hypothetical protein
MPSFIAIPLHARPGAGAARCKPDVSGDGGASGSPYHVAMSKSGTERPSDARRAAIRDQLTAGGMDQGVANRWCDAWEAEAALRSLAPDEDYWDAGKLWIDRQCAARKRPPN